MKRRRPRNWESDDQRARKRVCRREDSQNDDEMVDVEGDDVMVDVEGDDMMVDVEGSDEEEPEIKEVEDVPEIEDESPALLPGSSHYSFLAPDIDSGQALPWRISRPTWFRPSADIHSNASPFTMQHFEMDYAILPQRRFAAFGYRRPAHITTCAVMRFFGCTRTGRSALLRVWGFMPYFYADPPAGYDTSPAALATMAAEINKTLRTGSGQRWGRGGGGRRKPHPAVEGIEAVSRTTMYMPRPSEHAGKIYLKVTTTLPTWVVDVRRAFTDGVPGLVPRMQTFESNVLFELRCCVDADIVGCNWLEVPAGKYGLCPTNRLNSLCAIEADCSCADLISHAPVGTVYEAIPPLRILSFDIECLGYTDPGKRRRGVREKVHFPVAERPECAVIQIANVLQVRGEPAARVQNVFMLGSCAPMSGCDTHVFETERDLLLAWSRFVRIADPDIITGYNTVNFDFPYLMDRGEYLRLPELFWHMGRIRSKAATCRKSRFSSNQAGARDTHVVAIGGRVLMDVLDFVRANYKLGSYTLNNVSGHFLKMQKEDVHYTAIPTLQNGTPETRGRLAGYCLKDAMLPVLLFDKLDIINNQFEMVRVTGISLTMLMRRGQQIRVVSQLLRAARRNDIIMPVLTKQQAAAARNAGKFKGATVIEPIPGFYTVPITTLDFASLYPSIVIAHNICYTTLVRPEDVGLYAPDEITKTPVGAYFLTAKVKKGLLPAVLEDLLAARKRARAEMRGVTDKIKKNVLDGRQKALKISANSVYGFTGAANGKLPCLAIPTSVTSFGRQMLDDSKKWVEDRYCRANGCAHDAKVIYGDTDSVMIRFGTKSLAEAIRLGHEAGERITAEIFLKPISLDFEKTYMPYLLITKKRYAGLLFTKPGRADYIDTKGIECVRRDTCAMVRNALMTILKLFLEHNDKEGVKQYVRNVVSCLLRNKFDMSMLIISKTLARSVYLAKQEHSELAKRLAARDPATKPLVGDRIPYVYVQRGRKALACERSEDPDYVVQNGLPIDTAYYLSNKLIPVLTRILGPVLKPKELRELFNGPHTRSIAQPTSRMKTGMLRFAQKKTPCLSCRFPMATGEDGGCTAVCAACRPKEATVYEKIMDKRNYFEDLMSGAEAQCQSCQESSLREVICSNDDCPLYYMRRQVRSKLRDMQAKLERFDYGVEEDWRHDGSW